ncbi:glycoside hydrolase family 15 protein [Roseococcus microcysteis]|uniref:glycoside hydrolase family 15 protein n=1 Tax=Roseococcus microcysteis TaxID=2771361 RepID=UPI00168B5DFD|nr:glycoside hydrolase family 15 protein [Roseococcus microcysteis]
MPVPNGLAALPPPGREAERDFLPISAYGLIGDGHGAALVGRDGSMDWCCFERFDAPPSFARLLDRRRGGFLQLRPEGEVTVVRRRYLEETALLETSFETGTGIVVVTDLMPIASRPDGSAGPAGWIVRLVEGRRGEVAMRASHQPIVDLGAPQPDIRLGRDGCCVLPEGCPTLHADTPFALHPGAGEGAPVTAVASFTLRAGERRAFVLAPAGAEVADPAATAAEFFHATQAFWREWVRGITYAGPYRESVVRSALVLKLLIYAPTGAMVAAPTTSLPEALGGCRNWDYRFCWPRDACFVLYAFQKLGLRQETEGFFRFLLEAAEGTLPSVPPLFSLDGKRCHKERTVEEAEGYMGSRPVRLGNEAAEQHQLDVYGQLLDLMHLHARGREPLNGDLRRVGTALADHVAAHWQDPDHGIWEPRLPPRRNTHSAMMAWAALDRAQDLFGPHPGWEEARRGLLHDIRTRGVHAEGGYLTQVLDGEDVDAALLLAPMIHLPVEDAVLERTVDAVIGQLGEGPLVWRYRSEDGLPGEEGSFLACAFWLVDALLVLGRGEEARARFEALLALGNDLGLFSEEMEADGTFLGNFPQAFTHLALLQSALMLDLYEAGGAEALRGTHADRAGRIAARREDATARQERPRREEERA